MYSPFIVTALDASLNYDRWRIATFTFWFYLSKLRFYVSNFTYYI